MSDKNFHFKDSPTERGFHYIDLLKSGKVTFDEIPKDIKEEIPASWWMYLNALKYITREQMFSIKSVKETIDENQNLRIAYYGN